MSIRLNNRKGEWSYHDRSIEQAVLVGRLVRRGVLFGERVVTVDLGVWGIHTYPEWMEIGG